LISEPSKAPALVTDLELQPIHALVELVRNMTNRSIPIPHPPVGGNPCSSLLVPRMSTEDKRGSEKSPTRPRTSRRCPGFRHHQRPSASPEKAKRIHQHGHSTTRKLQTCSSNRARCSNGSFNSVYALQNSFPHIKPSKRSHSPGRDRCHLASGDMI